LSRASPVKVTAAMTRTLRSDNRGRELHMAVVASRVVRFLSGLEEETFQ
jgi:hypothetical protein